MWKERNKLGDNIRGKQTKFDFFIQCLLSAFHFPTLYVDPSNKIGVDVIGFSESTAHLLVIACTSGIIKDDLQKLDSTVNDMKIMLKEVCSKYKVIPALFVAKNADIYQSDKEYAKGRICILSPEGINKILEMHQTRRNSKEFIGYLERLLEG